MRCKLCVTLSVSQSVSHSIQTHSMGTASVCHHLATSPPSIPGHPWPAWQPGPRRTPHSAYACTVSCARTSRSHQGVVYSSTRATRVHSNTSPRRVALVPFVGPNTKPALPVSHMQRPTSLQRLTKPFVTTSHPPRRVRAIGKETTRYNTPIRAHEGDPRVLCNRHRRYPHCRIASVRARISA